ncbi:MAG: hypothetical protein VCD00_10430 [Candidatus Hydrogenedentota bacterium]
MNKGVIATVILCPLIAVGAFVFLNAESDENGDVSPISTEIAALPEGPPEPARELELEEAEEIRTELEERLAVSQEQVKLLEAKAAEVAKLLEQINQSEEEAEEETPEEEREKTLEDIRAKIEKNAVAGAQIKALTEMIYADFINGLDLDPDTKAELRALLAESYMETIALSQYATADGEIPWSEVDSWTREERAYLDEQLRALLSDEEYATWSEYSSTIDERQLEGTLRTQIRSFASGLTDENFEIVMQVAIEEFRAQQIALEQSNTPFTQSENILYQIRAMTEMRNRLGEYLSEAQYAEIENWLTMAENLMNSQLPQEEAE